MDCQKLRFKISNIFVTVQYVFRLFFVFNKKVMLLSSVNSKQMYNMTSTERLESLYLDIRRIA